MQWGESVGELDTIQILPWANRRGLICCRVILIDVALILQKDLFCTLQLGPAAQCASYYSTGILETALLAKCM